MYRDSLLNKLRESEDAYIKEMHKLDSIMNTLQQPTLIEEIAAIERKFDKTLIDIREARKEVLTANTVGKTIKGYDVRGNERNIFIYLESGIDDSAAEIESKVTKEVNKTIKKYKDDIEKLESTYKKDSRYAIGPTHINCRCNDSILNNNI